MKKFALVLSLISAVFLIAFQSVGAETDNYKLANKNNPGERFDAAYYAQASKQELIIFDFYSDYCGPCRAIAPHLQKVAAKNPDVMVYKVDINRKGHSGIDWQSPLARQYNLNSIPAFKIYDTNGKLIAEGQEAQAVVYKLISEYSQ